MPKQKMLILIFKVWPNFFDSLGSFWFWPIWHFLSQIMVQFSDQNHYHNNNHFDERLCDKYLQLYYHQYFRWLNHFATNNNTKKYEKIRKNTKKYEKIFLSGLHKYCQLWNTLLNFYLSKISNADAIYLHSAQTEVN